MTKTEYGMRMINAYTYPAPTAREIVTVAAQTLARMDRMGLELRSMVGDSIRQVIIDEACKVDNDLDFARAVMGWEWVWQNHDIWKMIDDALTASDSK